VRAQEQRQVHLLTHPPQRAAPQAREGCLSGHRRGAAGVRAAWVHLLPHR
jgi:hypothetical protein